MKPMYNAYKKNVELDARLVYASINGYFEPQAIYEGLTAPEAFGRARWLKHQSDGYIKRVAERVVQLEEEALVKQMKEEQETPDEIQG